MPFPHVQFSNFLAHQKQFIQIDDTQLYKRARVQLHWRGIVLRDEVEGALVKTKQQQIARQGELLVAEIDAKVGGVGIVPQDLHGAIVSSHYFLFEIDEAKCLRSWLDWFIRSGGLADQFSARGSTNYAAIRPHHVLNCEMPLPPLDEQRRIVSCIDGLASKIKVATELRIQAQQQAEALYRAGLAAAMHSGEALWERTTVGNVIQSIDAGWSPQCENRPANDGEWGVLKTTSVQWCEFRPRENKALPPMLTPRPELCIAEGDILVTRAGPLKRVGVVAAVRKAESRLAISDKLIRLRPDASKIDSRFLELSLASPFSQEYIVQRKTGLADAQVNISQDILRSTPIAYPPLAEQRRIVIYLDELQADVDALRKLQSETAAELHALMPSILSKAFRGEL